MSPIAATRTCVRVKLDCAAILNRAFKVGAISPSSCLGTGAALLQPLLETLLSLPDTRLPLGAQLLRLLLLLGRQHVVDVALETGLVNGQLGLHLRELLHRGPNTALVERNGL